jgi:hypothetical protein
MVVKCNSMVVGSNLLIFGGPWLCSAWSCGRISDFFGGSMVV